MSKKKFPKRVTPIKKINYYPFLWDTSVMDTVTIIELSSLGIFSHPLQPQTWHAKITEQVKPFFIYNPAKKYSDEWFYNHERAVVDSYRHIKEFINVYYIRPKKIFLEEYVKSIKMFFVVRYIRLVDWLIDFLFYIEFHFSLGTWLLKDLLLLSFLNSLPTSFVIRLNRFTDPFDYTVGPTWTDCPKDEATFSTSVYLSLYCSVNDNDMDTFVYIPNYLSMGNSFCVDPMMNNIKLVVPSLHSYDIYTGTVSYKSKFHLFFTHLILTIFSALLGFFIFFLLPYLYFPYLDLTNEVISIFVKIIEKVTAPFSDNSFYRILFNNNESSVLSPKSLENYAFYNSFDSVITIHDKTVFEKIFFKDSVYHPTFSIYPENAQINIVSSQYSLFHNFTSVDYETSCKLTKDFLPPVVNFLSGNSIETFNTFLRGQWNTIFQNGFFCNKSIVLYFYAESFVEAESFVKNLVSSLNWYLDLSPNIIVLEGIDNKKLCQISNDIFKPIFSNNLEHKICFGLRIGGFC